MKNRISLCMAALLSVLTLAACQPSYQIAWSPDGNAMAVIAADGLHTGDSSGKLSPPVPVNGKPTQVKWLGDSRHALVASAVTLVTWREAKLYLNPSRQKQSLDLARYILRQLNERGPDALDHDPKLENNPDWLGQASGIYLRENSFAEIKLKMGEERAKIFDMVEMTVNHVSLVDLKSGSPASEAKSLWHGFGEITDVRVSPDGKYALVVHQKEEKSELFDIEVVSLATNEPSVTVAESASLHADWSADSKQVVFIEGPEHEPAKPFMATLAAIKVRGDDGNLIDPEVEPTRYVHIAADDCADVRCLKDGRILFPCAEVHVPATTPELSTTERAYAYKPLEDLARPLMAASEGIHRIEVLETSPSERWAAIASADSKVQNILDLNTGKISLFSSTSNLDPSWRNADEVCFAKPVDKVGANQHTAEVVLHNMQTGSDKVLSQDWPEAAVKGFLMPEKSQ
ncbi:MAG TPA: hypothetical protein V6C72_20000 [Chroococcales cyanobacterium]